MYAVITGNNTLGEGNGEGALLMCCWVKPYVQKRAHVLDINKSRRRVQGKKKTQT